MLKNLFAVVGFVFVSTKATEWYMAHCQLQEEVERLRARCRTATHD